MPIISRVMVFLPKGHETETDKYPALYGISGHTHRAHDVQMGRSGEEFS
jgi:hypothetical protein